MLNLENIEKLLTIYNDESVYCGNLKITKKINNTGWPYLELLCKSRICIYKDEWETIKSLTSCEGELYVLSKDKTLKTEELNEEKVVYIYLHNEHRFVMGREEYDSLLCNTEQIHKMLHDNDDLLYYTWEETDAEGVVQRSSYEYFKNRHVYKLKKQNIILWMVTLQLQCTIWLSNHRPILCTVCT